MSDKKSKPTFIEATEAKAAAKADREASKRVFRSFLILLATLHLIVYLIVSQKGIPGYVRHLRDIAIALALQPILTFTLIGAIVLLYYSIIEWRRRYDQGESVYPPYPPVPELRFSNDIYIGSAWTRDGKQPGDIMHPDDEVVEPHVILKEKGLVGNIHVKGGVGGGKTATFIEPVTDQAIMKFPKPYPPEHFTLGPDGRYVDVIPPRPKQSLFRRKSEKEYQADPFDRSLWNPYVGMTPEEAQVEYQRLLQEHENKKWFLFLIDPKGDLTDFVAQSAEAAGRGDDVIVLEPGGEYTYNPLGIIGNELVLSELIMDGIEAVAGQTIQMYWRNTQSEWLANALTVLRAASPSKLTFKTVLTMARSEQMRNRWVAEAENKMREYQEEEERYRKMGREYHGDRVNPAAIEFFRDWDDAEADPAMKRNVVSGIKAQAKYFVDAVMAPFLCPEMPATFEGFEKMIDKGQIVVLRCPIGEYGPVGKVLGILLLADAQQAARVRIIRPDMNQERMGAFIVDEVANYLNKLTRDFISINRQSRVACIFAHQSQGQLMEDKKTETSFNDNLRSKVSYSAPNAEAGRREASLFGSRLITKEVYSESTNLQRVEREGDGESLRAKGGESKGISVRLEEVERPWFKAEEFVSLKLGECIVSEFDGVTTLPPRKIKAPLYFMTPRAQRLETIAIRPRNLKPHPVVRLQTKVDEDYLATALDNSGFIITETLRDNDGIQGIKFVTEVGTVIVPYSRLSGDVFDIIAERLADSTATIILADIASAKILRDDCGVTLETPLPLPAALEQKILIEQDGEEIEKTLGEIVFDSPRQFLDYQSLVREITNEEVGYSPDDGWDYHWSQPLDDCRAAIVRDSRLYINAYERVGHALYALDSGLVEDLHEELRMVVDEALEQLRESLPAEHVLEDEFASVADEEEANAQDHNEDIPETHFDFATESLESKDVQDLDPDDDEDIPETYDDVFGEDVPEEIDIASMVDSLDDEDVEDLLFGEEFDDIDLDIDVSESDILDSVDTDMAEVDEASDLEAEKDATPSSHPESESSKSVDEEELPAMKTPPKERSATGKKKKKSSRNNKKQSQHEAPLTLFDLDDVIAPSPFDAFTLPHTNSNTEEDDSENSR